MNHSDKTLITLTDNQIEMCEEYTDIHAQALTQIVENKLRRKKNGCKNLVGCFVQNIIIIME